MARKSLKVNWSKRAAALREIGIPVGRSKKKYSAEEKQKIRRLTNKFKDVISTPYAYVVKKSKHAVVTQKSSDGIRYKDFVAVPTGMRKEAHGKGFTAKVKINRAGLPEITHINDRGNAYKKTTLTTLNGGRLLRFLKTEYRKRKNKQPNGLPTLRKGKTFVRVSIGNRTVNRAFSNWSDLISFLEYYQADFKESGAWSHVSIDTYQHQEPFTPNFGPDAIKRRK